MSFSPRQLQARTVPELTRLLELLESSCGVRNVGLALDLTEPAWSDQADLAGELASWIAREPRPSLVPKLLSTPLLEELVRRAAGYIEQADELELWHYPAISAFVTCLGAPWRPVQQIVFACTEKPDFECEVAGREGVVARGGAGPRPGWLVYNRTPPSGGLTLAHLANWQQREYRAIADLDAVLAGSLSSLSPGERQVWQHYAAWTAYDQDALALLPQAHHRIDSRTQREAEEKLDSQRADFLLCGAGARAVVLEIDGGRHYQDEQAARVNYDEDWRLRSLGYTVRRLTGTSTFDPDCLTRAFTEIYKVLGHPLPSQTPAPF